jgi:hypothetical protein
MRRRVGNRSSRDPEADPTTGRVLLVPPASVASGVVTYVAELCALLEPDRCACVVVPGSDLDQLLPQSCERIPTTGGRGDLSRVLLRRARRFSFVQTHGARSLLAARVAGLRGPRLGHVFHEFGSAHRREQAELLLARGIPVAANSPPTAQWLFCKLGVEAEVLPPVVRHRRLLDRSSARAALQLSEGALTIGVIGRLAAVKAPLLPVEAAARLSVGPLQVVFVGEGPERKRIEARARELGVQVRIVGPRPEAGQLLNAFDVVACPSSLESFGLSMAQGAAAERPLAVVDSPGARFVSNGGRLSPLSSPTPDAFAVALMAARDAPAESLARLRGYVLGQFGPDAARERYRQYYEALKASSLMS